MDPEEPVRAANAVERLAEKGERPPRAELAVGEVCEAEGWSADRARAALYRAKKVGMVEFSWLDGHVVIAPAAEAEA